MFPNIYATLLVDNAVTAIIGSNPMRAYRHGNAPQDTSKPYIVYSSISGVPENTLSETPNVDKFSIQVDCYHQTDSGVQSLATAVRDALEVIGYMSNIPIDERESETKLFRVVMDFDIWLTR